MGNIQISKTSVGLNVSEDVFQSKLDATHHNLGATGITNDMSCMVQNQMDQRNT